MAIRDVLRVILLCAVPAVGLSQTFPLSGYVVDGLTNQPLPGIRLHLYEWTATTDGLPGKHGPAADPVISDSAGRFTFPKLERGWYVLRAELAQEIYTFGEAVEQRFLEAIEVGVESQSQVVIFRILPRASIHGTLRDENGEIVDRASVDIYRRDRRGGRMELVYAGGAGLDDRGRYVISDLWPGDYIVCAEPRNMWPEYFSPSGESEIEYHPGGESRVYTETCYPDADSRTTFLHLSSGARQNLDLTIGSAASVTLRTNENVEIFHAEVPCRMPAGAYDPHDPDDERWKIRNVPPGNYIIYARTADDARAAAGLAPLSVVRQPVTVTSQPLTLTLHPEKPGRIDVHLHDPNGQAVGARTASVQFLRFDFEPRHGFYGIDGLEFTIEPGTYWLFIRPQSPFCVTAQSLTGGTLQHGKVTVTPGMSARLDVRLDTNCGTVAIRAASNGEAVPFARFLLLVNGTPEEPGDAITGNLDAQGQVSIPRMAPGRYRLWAWVPDAEGYLGPELADPDRRPVEVVVSAGQTSMVTVEPVRSPGVLR